MSEKVRPIVLTDEETGIKYTLEFDRETVKVAEMHGFVISELEDKMMTKIPELFFWAFRKHHKNLSRSQTDDILFNKLNGMPEGMMERLGQLYIAPYESLVQNEDTAKNARMAVEL